MLVDEHLASRRHEAPDKRWEDLLRRRDRAEREDRDDCINGSLPRASGEGTSDRVEVLEARYDNDDFGLRKAGRVGGLPKKTGKWVSDGGRTDYFDSARADGPEFGMHVRVWLDSNVQVNLKELILQL